MPPDGAPVGTPQDWLRRAKSNLALAKQRKPDEALWEDLCFDTEQAAEKAIKAVLIFHAIDFPKTHDIRALLTLLEEYQHKVPGGRQSISPTTRSRLATQDAWRL